VVKIDRRVHIRLRDGREVVRYDKSGKWWIEHPDGRRWHLMLSDAVSWAKEPGAEVFFGLPGGQRFDKRVQEARS
jgi:hypothetical protein